MTRKRTGKNVYSESDYKIITQLYNLSKGKNKVPRLPIKDARGVSVNRINKQVQISFRRALSRIAAMW